MSLVLRRTALFVFIVLVWALIAAAVAHASTREIVPMEGYAPGTIVVKTTERKLYFVLDGSRAMRFPVGVGKEGQTWTGTARVSGKYVRPAWAPPDDIRRENPALPEVIKGGAKDNPMGAAALTLDGGDYAIHGTNRPESIGHFVSHGCIRMHNEDIRALYRLVTIGTRVVVLQ
jgi:lipoprotein-anchoring transpeptidase ErfK/SrfK